MLRKSLDYYKSLDYNIIVKKEELDGENWYVAFCNEFGLSACHGTGDSEIEAIDNFKVEKDFFIDFLYAEGIEIPEPENEEVSNFSGVFTVRTTPWTHYHLSRQAKLAGVSLNAYINTILAFKLGQDTISQSFIDSLNELKQDISKPVEELLEKTNSLIYDKRNIVLSKKNENHEEKYSTAI